MMDANMMANLLSYCAQVACIAVVSWVLARIVPIDSAAIRYTYWRAVLGIAVALPWMQGRIAPAAGTTIETMFTAAGTAASIDSGSATASAAPEWPVVVAAVLASGVVLRLAWIAAGLVRLRRMRHSGRLADASAAHADLQWAIGTRAEIRYVNGLAQPVTFGTVSPVVLLPEWLSHRGTHIERAVLAHELFHVRRHDWIWTVLEELLRAALWFSPGLWWLVSRVQLAREELVDELTVLATSERRTYLEALLAFAEIGGRDPHLRLPVAAFARGHHLFRRMVLISKEAVMSSTRVVLSCAVMALVVAVGSWGAMTAFPLAQVVAAQEAQAGPGPLEQAANPITPENPVPRRTFSTNPVYPAEAAAVNLTATIALRVTLDQFGRVAEVRMMGRNSRTPDASRGEVQRALDAMTQSAITAVRQWQYDAPAKGPISFDVTILFAPGAEPRVMFARGPGGIVAGAAGGRVGGARAGRVGGMPGGRAGAIDSATAAAPPPPPPNGIGTPVRVGGAILQPAKTKHVTPVYPAVAQSARVQGIVILETVIGPDGRVLQARVIRSIPLLDQAAIDAVMQWEFTPTLLNGVPVPIIMTMTVNFSLSEQ